ncbi:carcinoembryonic antigen-related cell adhesion molecule 20-like [Hyla sarda]|uniref:carcinoembryonic antigen-related cell adhesion molecule 20-like n=1 Tax=Hyla sarda TaxID=327740 RepID=UPI0024C356D9|nr:carcinoembryonic antigen-related cell adhesion molecule 20-like [Hyla sarda]
MYLIQIHHFSHCALLAVLLGLTMDLTSGMDRILIPQYPIINGSVTMSVTGITGDIQTASWFKGPDSSSQYQILAYFPGSSSPLVPGPLYSPRFLPFNNGSLQIKDLLITDGGNYIAKIQTGKQEDIAVTLTVYEPVTKPKMTAAPSNQPKENETLTLTCDTSQAIMIRWSRRGGSISTNTKLSGNNKTLTFSGIKREDAGEYQCEAQNLVSKDSSDPYKVTVAYGPDYVKIEGSSYVRPGSSITLSCSADSFPTPEYQWKHNNTVLEEKTNKYSISSAINENEGLYWCIVKNTVTARTASVSIYVNVTEEYIELPKDKGSAMIIGIVVAVVLLLILIAAIIYLLILHKRRKSLSDTNSTLKDSSRNGQADIPTQTAEQHELQYASIEFSNNMPKKEQKPEAIYENRSPQAAPPPTDNVVYSELKLR